MTSNPEKLTHPTLAAGRWGEMPFPLQMGNIGSEISRALNSKRRGNLDRMNNAAARALELFSFSIEANRENPSRLRELCRAKEEFCDFIFGDNTFNTDPIRLIRYYDQFVTLSSPVLNP